MAFNTTIVYPTWWPQGLTVSQALLSLVVLMLSWVGITLWNCIRRMRTDDLGSKQVDDELEPLGEMNSPSDGDGISFEEVFLVARSYDEANDDISALKTYLQAITRFTGAEDYAQFLSCFHRISDLYNKQGDIRNAVKYKQIERLMYENVLLRINEKKADGKKAHTKEERADSEDVAEDKSDSNDVATPSEETENSPGSAEKDVSSMGDLDLSLRLSPVSSRNQFLQLASIAEKNGLTSLAMSYVAKALKVEEVLKANGKRPETVLSEEDTMRLVQELGQSSSPSSGGSATNSGDQPDAAAEPSTTSSDIAAADGDDAPSNALYDKFYHLYSEIGRKQYAEALHAYEASTAAKDSEAKVS